MALKKSMGYFIFVDDGNQEVTQMCPNTEVLERCILIEETIAELHKNRSDNDLETTRSTTPPEMQRSEKPDVLTAPPAI